MLGRELLVARPLAQRGDTLRGFARLAVAELGEFLTLLLAAGAAPHARMLVLAAIGVGEDRLEMARDAGAMVVEFGQQAVVGAVAHGAGDDDAITFIGRQHVGLGVVEVLQAVFDATQEVIGGGKFGHGLGGKQAAVRQPPQHLQRRLDLQRGIAPAADQLEHLGDELDLADAAGTELDVVGLVLLRHFLADLRVQFAHGVDGAEVEVLAEHERPSDRFQFVQANEPVSGRALIQA
jgi:hypothetical protein